MFQSFNLEVVSVFEGADEMISICFLMQFIVISFGTLECLGNKSPSSLLYFPKQNLSLFFVLRGSFNTILFWVVYFMCMLCKTLPPLTDFITSSRLRWMDPAPPGLCPGGSGGRSLIKSEPPGVLCLSEGRLEVWGCCNKHSSPLLALSGS